jgi:hypothetical protein
MNATKSRWPKVCQRAVKKLARVVLKEDLDALVSSSIATQFKLNQLWATSARVWCRYGLKAGVSPKDTAEWTDLQEALGAVRQLPTGSFHITSQNLTTTE